MNPDDIHVFIDLKTARHYAGDRLPVGATLAGMVRVGPRDVGALLILPQGLWVRYTSGETNPLPAVTGSLWVDALRRKHRLSVEECAGLAGTTRATAQGWTAGRAVTARSVKRLLQALNLLG